MSDIRSDAVVGSTGAQFGLRSARPCGRPTKPCQRSVEILTGHGTSQGNRLSPPGSASCRSNADTELPFPKMHNVLPRIGISGELPLSSPVVGFTACACSPERSKFFGAVWRSRKAPLPFEQWRYPGLSASGPDMADRLQRGCIVQRSGLQAQDVSTLATHAASRVVKPGSARIAECTSLQVAGIASCCVDAWFCAHERYR